MGEQIIEDRIYTHEEYDQLLQESDYKIEYYAGYIQAMAGGSPNHGKAIIDFTTALAVSFKGTKCNVFGSDQAINIPKYDCYLYPDISVVCGKDEYERKHHLKNPSMIVEVASKSTAARDTGDKMLYYFSLPSLKEYVIVRVDKPLVTVHSKKNEEWAITVTFGLQSKIYLPNHNLHIEMKEIYRRVEGLENMKP